MSLPPIELLEKQISRTDQQLLMHLIIEQRETNRLLAQMIGSTVNNDVSTDPVDGYKRQELMKRISRLPIKPPGWNKWETEDMRKLLKEAQ
jgi:hypothetical protein